MTKDEAASSEALQRRAQSVAEDAWYTGLMRADLHPIDALGERIAEQAAQIDSATHRFLTDLREFDEAGGWYRQGAISCAHWLNWRCGIDLGAAREKVRVARALAKLPKVDEALRRGEVSFSKVRAITRVATPKTEQTLIDYARHGTASHMEKIARLFRQVQPSEPGKPEEPRHYLRTRETDDGMVRLEVQLTPEEAAIVLGALDSLPLGEGRYAKRDRAQNLVTLAEERLRGAAPARPPVEVVVHVDAQTLSGHLPDGSGVSAETSRRLLCDAGVVPVLEDQDGKILNMGRKMRTIPSAIRRALQVRDKGCRFPGCSNVIVDGHHLVHWADGGETSLSGVISLCRVHHGMLHEGGFAVKGTPDEGLTFFSPSGAPIPKAAPPPNLSDFGVEPLRAAARADGIEISPATNMSGWDGVHPDYGLAVQGLLGAEARA